MEVGSANLVAAVSFVSVNDLLEARSAKKGVAERLGALRHQEMRFC